MSPMLPTSLAGVAMAYIGAPFWLWFLLLEAAVLHAAVVDMLESSPPPTTRRPSKASHALEELPAAHQRQLGRPPGKSIHLGHPPASEPHRLEELTNHPRGAPKSTSAEFYAYGRRTLSATQVSSSELLPPDDSANYTPNGRLELRGAQ